MSAKTPQQQGLERPQAQRKMLARVPEEQGWQQQGLRVTMELTDKQKTK